MESIEAKVDSLCSTILKTDAEDWEKRNKAMLQLTDMVNTFKDLSAEEINDAFTANVFRMMKDPTKNMILDLRSQQVRDTCHFLVKLAEVTGDRMKPFLRDVFSTILEGVKIPHKVTSGYIDECIVFLIKHVTFKCAIVLVMHEIKESKSKVMRERCLEYINLILVHWDITDKELDFFVDAIKLGLEDAAVRAREISRAAYLNMYNLYPEKAEKIKSLLPKAYQQKLTRTEEEGLTDLPSSPGAGGSLSSSLNSSGLLKVTHQDPLSMSVSTEGSLLTSSTATAAHTHSVSASAKSHTSHVSTHSAKSASSTTSSAKHTAHSHAPSHTPAHTPAHPPAHPPAAPTAGVGSSLQNAEVLPVPPKKKPATVNYPKVQPQSSEGVSAKFERLGSSSSSSFNLMASSSSNDAGARSSDEGVLKITRQGSMELASATATPAAAASNIEEQAVLSIQARMRGAISRRRSIALNPFAGLAASPKPVSQQQYQQEGSSTVAALANSAGSLSSGTSGITSHATRSTVGSQSATGNQGSGVTFAPTTKERPAPSGGSVHSASSAGSSLRTPATKKTGLRSSQETPAFNTSTVHTTAHPAPHTAGAATSRKASTGSADSAPTPRSTSAARSPRAASTSVVGATPADRSRSASKTRAVSSASATSPEKVAPGVRAVRHEEVASAESASFPKDLSVNMRVNVITRDGRLPGLIKFIGQTKFSPGIWIGVSLDAAVGKNNGTVQGKHYFDCAAEHGLFVKEDVIERVGYEHGDDSSETRHSNGSVNGAFHGNGHNVDRDTASTTSQESPSAASSGCDGSEKKGSSITGVLKVKLSQMMEMLNHQLEIVVQLEEEDRNRASSGTPANAAHSKHATELYSEIVRITNQEQSLINAFKQHLHDRLV